MDFNFYEEYKSYSNFELLKILKQPADYQPAAVDAATLILKEREVSEQENAEVNYHFEAIAQQQQLKKEKVASFKQRFTGFLESYIRPDAEVRPAKWLDILLIVLAVQYAWLLFGLFQRLVLMNQYGISFFTFDFGLLLGLFYFLYIPLAFYLLLEKKRWGWILLFVDYSLALIFELSHLTILLADFENIKSINGRYIFSVVFKCALLYFLWRKDICALFKITDKTKQYTAVAAILGSPVLIALVYILLDL